MTDLYKSEIETQRLKNELLEDSLQRVFGGMVLGHPCRKKEHMDNFFNKYDYLRKSKYSSVEDVPKHLRRRLLDAMLKYCRGEEVNFL